MKTELIDKITEKNMNFKKIGLIRSSCLLLFCFALILSLPQINATPLKIADWNFNEGSGTTANSSTSFAQNATFIGTPSWTAQGINTTLAYMNVTQGKTSLWIPENMSVCVRIQTDSTTGTKGIYVTDGGTLTFFLGVINANPRCQFNDGSGNTVADGLVAVSDNIFHQICCVLAKNKNLTIYEDGAFSAATANTKNNLPFFTGDAMIGVSSGAVDNFIGIIDFLKIYNGSLSDNDVLTLNNTLTIQLLSPANSSTSLIKNQSFYMNVVANNLINATLYIWNDTGLVGTNDTIITGSSNSSNLSFSLPELQKYHWNYYVCSDDTCAFATNNFTITISNFVENSQTFNSASVEGNNENFLINISYVSSEWNNILGYLNYNGTSYLGTKIGTGNNLVFNASLVIPATNSTSQKIPFYWNFILTNSSGDTYINSTFQNQTITKITPLYVNISCPTGYSPSMFFDFATEQNLTYTNSTINYNVQYGVSNTIASIYGTFTNKNNFSICINDSVPYYTIGYGEIQYSADNYNSRRFYIFNGTRITNITINNTLSLLDTSLAQPFTFNAKNVVLTPYVNHYLALLRWYPGLNEFKIVEMGKTDNSGNTIMSVRQNDVDYKIALYTQTGQLVYITSSSRFSCSVLPCNFPVVVNAATDFTTTFNIQSLLIFNSTTKIFTYIWNDPSQATTKMNLSVYKITGTDETIICQDSASSFTGILTCNVSAYTGNLRAVVFRSASPSSPYAWLDIVINAAATGLDDSIKLFVGFVFSVLLSMIGIFMGVVPALIFSVVGLLIGLYFDIVTWWIVAGVIVLAVAIYTILKRIG